MKSFLLVFVVSTLVAFALPARSVAEEASASEVAATEEEAETAKWLKDLDDAMTRLDIARQQLGELEGAKGRGASRRYPRGDAKAKYLDDLKVTRKEYEAARLALPDVVEGARRAGIPLGVLEPYEAAAESAAPVASVDDDESDEASDDEAVDEGSALEEGSGDDEADAEDEEAASD